MSEKFEKIRESIDLKLDALQAKAEAFDANLKLTQEKVAERVEHEKQAFHDMLEHLKAAIPEQKNLAEHKKEKLLKALDDLKSQIAPGKAEALDAWEKQQEKISRSLAKFEERVDKELADVEEGLDQTTKELVQKYFYARNRLNAEMDAAITRLKGAVALKSEVFEKRKKALAEKIAALKIQLEQRRKEQVEKWGDFGKELTAGTKQVGKAFKDLFS